MEVGLTILLFIMVILNLSTAIPLLRGLKFRIEDYTCSYSSYSIIQHLRLH